MKFLGPVKVDHVELVHELIDPMEIDPVELDPVELSI